MNYVIAAYGVTALALVGYGWMIARERAALLRREREGRSSRDGRGSS